MGFRYHRQVRTKAGDVHVSKSGVSLSRRLGKWVTVNTRNGITVRTPIKGLSWRTSWKGLFR